MTSLTPSMSAPSWRTGRRRDEGSRATGIRFRRALVLMLMTLVLPGSAQLVAGRRRTGRIAMRIWFAGWLAALMLGIVGLVSHAFVFWLFTNTGFLALVRFLLIGLAIGWAYLFANAWMLGEPLTLRRQHRLAMVGINGMLCFSVAGSLLFASHVVGVQRDFLATMFAGTKVTSAHAGRFNVLLLGGDSGSDRWGMRPDSINVASIDAQTGRTVLIGLPRNMLNFPFAKGSVMAQQFPNGYRCNTACFNDDHQLGLHELNSLVTYAGAHRALFKGYGDPGIEATKEAVEGITGLKINYFGMINLMGFRKLVQAVGGIKLHVREPIPIGGIGSPIDGYVKPGYRTLNGFQALWFARSRVAADDYSRMARQKCVLAAMLKQVSPQTVILNFSKIAHASESTFRTDVPESEVDTFAQLALKARSQPIRTISLVPPQVNTSRPNIAKIKRMVAQAIAESVAPPAKGARAHATHRTPAQPTGEVGGSLGNMQQGYLANDSANLASSC